MESMPFYLICHKKKQISGINRRILARPGKLITHNNNNNKKLHFNTTYYFINYAEIQDHGMVNKFNVCVSSNENENSEKEPTYTKKIELKLAVNIETT